MIVAHISDTHILAPGRRYRAVLDRSAGGEQVYAEFDTAQHLTRAIAEINRLNPRPDVTIVTGDLVDHGDPAEYDHLRALLAPLTMPVFVIPGNHDARDPLRRAFRDAGYLPAGGYLQYAIDDYPLRLVALDTLIPGDHRGMLCAERLQWLERTLAARPDRPTLLLMHHPPFPTAITHMDEYGLENAAALADVLARHGQVERVVCGHLHRAIDRRFGGTVAGTAPSTAHQIRLDLVPDAALRFIAEPPGYQLHVWQENGGLVTHTAVIGDWAGPPAAA
ncbi:MAG TPA: phosphodiesterase [Stellaceae bacterium]|nr:phosphodiesterase [Stellaceae bacterium]